MFISKLITKVVGDKRQWRAYLARKRDLPASYRAAVDGIERYLMYFGRGDGAGWASMLEDLVELFEQSAANRTPIREIVGEDPVEFIEAFAQNYPEGQWRLRERQRLITVIKQAAGEHLGSEEGSR